MLLSSQTVRSPRFLASIIPLMMLAALSPVRAQVTWTGAIDSDWSTAGNWTPGVPDSSSSIYIFDATVDLTGAAEASFVYLETSTLNISASGSLTTNNLAADYGSVLHVTGEGSQWNSAYLDLYTAAANFTDGATITTAEVRLATIYDDNVASITVQGGAQWTTDRFTLGGSGTATVTVSGGSLTSLTDSYIGLHGSLTVSDGGTLQTGADTSYALTIGPGSLTVAGEGSTWTSPGYANIGVGGEGTLNITDGGQVTIGSFLSGSDGGDHGIILIDGTGSKLTTTGIYYPDYNYTAGDLIGFFGASTINITNGGRYDALAPELIVGYQNSGEGSAITVSHANSQFNVSGDLFLGNFGEATLVVSEGAAVTTAGDVYIAHGVLDDLAGNIRGTATITGTGSTWAIDGHLGIGAYVDHTNYTLGTLTIADGATVSVAAGSGEVGIDRNSTLNIGTGGTAGSLQAGSLALGGSLNFNHSDNVTFDTPISDYAWSAGPGTLTKTGSGTLTLAGTHTYTGTTSVTGGMLDLTGDISSSSVTTVSGSGTLSGTGSVGTLTIGSGGTLAPGNSPGTLFAGDTTFEAGGIFEFEVANTAGEAGTAYDLLSISGTLFLTATAENPFVIDLVSLNGLVAGAAANFNPTVDYSFTFLTTTGGIAGFSADKFTLLTSGFTNPFNGTWSVTLTNSGHDLSLSYAGASAIPEPSTYAALFGACALVFAASRRRKHAV